MGEWEQGELSIRRLRQRHTVGLVCFFLPGRLDLGEVFVGYPLQCGRDLALDWEGIQLHFLLPSRFERCRQAPLV